LEPVILQVEDEEESPQFVPHPDKPGEFILVAGAGFGFHPERPIHQDLRPSGLFCRGTVATEQYRRPTMLIQKDEEEDFRAPPGSSKSNSFRTAPSTSEA
jgi:hypothetical protein